ncbi:2-hydroxyacid dehydrogenase [Novosphingobium piscinae]|uniref:2-hydroxyacid dehydrogenase n=1 Tax=Novosphingobium piscinae TaxID=1507448 RepID=A0A7X1FVB6_9SPHN|nr:2-hydroxyacid dehydrogenase [Novosphingobium piscinae]MBC2667645.1 2-hydroxyacid dehydrogenase [Novosphingobium piscinae]
MTLPPIQPALPPAVLQPAPIHPAVTALLAPHVPLHRLWEQDDPAAWLREHGAAIRGLAVSTLAGPVGADLFDRLPALEIVANFGVGYDNVDVAAARARGLVVTNTPGVLDEEVADLAVALLLATVRQLPQAERFLRAGGWRQGPFPLSPTLRGRRIGLLGLGAIGKAIARRLEGFGVDIAYHGRTRQEGVGYPWYPSAQALAAACDTLIAILPGGAATRHIVDAAVLAALGPEGVFINVARGSVVDEAALIAALQDGTILAAGLDVFAEEPAVPEALLALPNAVLLPHVGSASVQTRTAMGELVARNLLAWFREGRALTPV